MAIRSTFLAAAITALSMLASESAAHAQSVERAQERWFEADFDAARTDFESILAGTQLSIADAVTAHRYLAALDEMRGDQHAAQTHADAAVALDPEADAPEGASRTTVALFAASRARQGGRTATLSLDALPSAVSGDHLAVRARLGAAPEGLASVLVLRCGSDEQTARADSVALEVDARGSVVCTAEARTEHGAVLFRARRVFDSSGRGRGSDHVARTNAPDDTSVRRRRIGWIVGTSAGAVVASVVIGVLVHGRNADAQFGGTTVVGW